MLRASSYNIYVDLPDNKEDMLLVHGYTGAYDKVSQRVATYVRSLEVNKTPKPLFGKWTPEAPIAGQVISPSEQTLEVLKKRGYLTEKAVEEEREFFAKIANKLHALQNKPGFIFVPTYDCNLRCSYCFQDHMRTNPAFNHLLRAMSPEVIDRIFTAIPQMEAYHGVSDNQHYVRNIGLFGGEPLLEKNLAIVEYIVNKALKMGKASFWAVTNATELMRYKHLLNPQTISFLQITLDGPPNEHDKRRIYPDGSGSFEKISENILMALDQGVQVNVRLNIDRNNIGKLPALADEIVKRGWNDKKNFSVYTAPIHAANNQTDVKVTFGSWDLDRGLTQLRQQYPNMNIIKRPDDGIKNQARKLFVDSNFPQFKPTFCGAHNGMYVFDTFGDIYACWERLGDPQIRIGVVAENGDFALDAVVNDMWRSRNVTTNPVCHACPYALQCGGGCAILAEGHRGGFFKNFCDGFASRFRASVAEAYLEHAAGIRLEPNLEPVCDL
jgi:uncharacterized protein